MVRAYEAGAWSSEQLVHEIVNEMGKNPDTWTSLAEIFCEWNQHHNGAKIPPSM
jgi:hypothetical protein